MNCDHYWTCDKCGAATADAALIRVNDELRAEVAALREKLSHSAYTAQVEGRRREQAELAALREDLRKTCEFGNEMGKMRLEQNCALQRELAEARAEVTRLTQELLGAIKGREEARALLARFTTLEWQGEQAFYTIRREARAFLRGDEARHNHRYRIEANGAVGPCEVCGARDEARRCTCTADDFGGGVRGARERKASLAAGVHDPACPARDEARPKSNDQGNPDCWYCVEGILHHPEVCGSERPARDEAPGGD